MPRVARKKASTGIYHIVIRGINKQRIFEDEEDYQTYLDTIKFYSQISGYKVYAYCLMSNHIHLLLQTGKEELGIIFRRIGASYVRWYNKKYGRVGYLFQDRYKSEIVENEVYLLTVLRYIHLNPVKANIVKGIQEYKWSSYGEYFSQCQICDTEFVLNIYSENLLQSINKFKMFHLEENKDQCLDYDPCNRISDLEAIHLIQKIAVISSPSEIQKLDKEKRNDIIRKLRQMKLSIRQIQRLTGVSFGIIKNVKIS